jgi:hypothetical protein
LATISARILSSFPLTSWRENADASRAAFLTPAWSALESFFQVRSEMAIGMGE